jgi:predicted membrane protein
LHNRRGRTNLGEEEKTEVVLKVIRIKAALINSTVFFMSQLVVLSKQELWQRTEKDRKRQV